MNENKRARGKSTADEATVRERKVSWRCMHCWISHRVRRCSELLSRVSSCVTCQNLVGAHCPSPLRLRSVGSLRSQIIILMHRPVFLSKYRRLLCEVRIVSLSWWTFPSLFVTFNHSLIYETIHKGARWLLLATTSLLSHHFFRAESPSDASKTVCRPMRNSMLHFVKDRWLFLIVQSRSGRYYYLFVSFLIIVTNLKENIRGDRNEWMEFLLWAAPFVRQKSDVTHWRKAPLIFCSVDDTSYRIYVQLSLLCAEKMLMYRHDAAKIFCPIKGNTQNFRVPYRYIAQILC